MEDIKRILVVSRMTKSCRKAVHYGFSLSKKYGAELYVLHVVYDPFMFGEWNLPMPTIQDEYKKAMKEAKKELEEVIAVEREKGVPVKELIKEGRPAREILKTVEEEGIDLIILLAHEEGHLEHFLFGRSNEEIVRRMPCSVLMVKKEPEPVSF
jgi:nucleotide-binding universal stress UspA family protein